MTTLSNPVAETAEEIAALLRDLDRPCWIIRHDGRVAATADEDLAARGPVLAAVGPLPTHRLGDSAFRAAHGVRAAYAAGAMANGIASPALV
ncbi:2-nitropropane dioxygenase, partial [Nocardia sp. NPDC004722]